MGELMTVFGFHMSNVGLPRGFVQECGAGTNI